MTASARWETHRLRDPRLHVAALLAFALFVGAAACSKNATTPAPAVSPSPTGSIAPDTLYVQDTGTKSIRVYKGASGINGFGTPFESLPTSDISRADVVYAPAADVLWYPSAYPLATPGPSQSTPILVWTTASMKNQMPPTAQTPYTNGEGTATYDVTHNCLYVANINGPTIQVFQNATAMGGASTPSASVTLTWSDPSVTTPRPQEMLYDAVNDRLFVSGQGSTVAVFDAFGTFACAASGSVSRTANRVMNGLNSPDGLAYSSSADKLFIAEDQNHDIVVVANASTASGPTGHTQTITNFSSNDGLAYDQVRDLLFVYDAGTNAIFVLPNATAVSGSHNSVANQRVIFDSTISLSGFGIAVDTTH